MKMEGRLQFLSHGDLLQWRILPVALYSTIGSNSEAKSYNRTESFTIACDPMSRLNVDVYRVQPLFANSGTESHNMIDPRLTSNDSVAFTNIFTNYQFDKLSDLVTEFVGKSLEGTEHPGPARLRLPHPWRCYAKPVGGQAHYEVL